MLRSCSLLGVLALFVALLAPSTASAGSVGLYNATGFHFGPSLSEVGGTGRWLNEGGGIEVLLAPRDSRVHGRLRFAYNAIVDLDGGVRHTGIVSAGVQVQLLPDLEKVFGLYALLDVGVAPFVTNSRLFLYGDIGAGVRVRPIKWLELFGEVTALMRWEQAFYAGPQIYLGARFTLD